MPQFIERYRERIRWINDRVLFKLIILIGAAKDDTRKQFRPFLKALGLGRSLKEDEGISLVPNDDESLHRKAVPVVEIKRDAYNAASGEQAVQVSALLPTGVHKF